MFGLSYLDLGVIVIYFLGLTWIGLRTYSSIKNTGDYFMGGRRFNKLLMIGHAMGTGTHTDQPVAVAGACYQHGLAGIWYQWMWMFSTPFYWLLSPVYRRLRYITTGDFFERRYGKTLGAWYAAMGLLYFTTNCGLMLKGTATTIDVITDGQVPSNYAVVIMTILFVSYSMVGGLVAAVITDFIQGIFILVLSFLLIPFALNAAGGIGAIHDGLPADMFSFIAPGEITLFFIVAVIINGLVSIVVQPHHMAVGGAGKEEISCRVGWTYGSFVKRFMTLGWAFIGVFAAFLYPGLGEENREMAFGLAVNNLLPAGLVGLMLASMAAAVMSTCDSFMVGGSALFTRNFYAKYFNRDASEKHYLGVARLASLVVVVGGVAYAFWLDSVIQGVLLLWKFTAFFGVAFWMALIWRRANRFGVFASVISMIICVVLTSDLTSFGANWDIEYQIALYLPVGILTFVVASLLTQPEDDKQLDDFYALLNTPVGEEAKLKAAGVDIMLEGDNIEPRKAGAESLLERGHSLVLVDLLSLHKKFSFKRYRIDLLGFVAACLAVAGIILIGILLAGIGS
ncbi:sodium:solute symporter family protein [Kordiimonas sp.]|uniref:sodium:solute symporter family protein n=1 Tax=Kordiimonas sp. TaxID=1970157 RepID=UPI003A92212F